MWIDLWKLWIGPILLCPRPMEIGTLCRKAALRREGLARGSIDAVGSGGDRRRRKVPWLGWCGDSGVLPVRDTVECAGQPPDVVPAVQWFAARAVRCATAVCGEQPRGTPGRS